MTPTRPVRSPVIRATLVLILISLLGAWNGVAALLDPPQTNPRHPAITWTAVAAFAGWGLGVFIGAPGRLSTSVYRPIAVADRALYTGGCAMCLLHVVVAFHIAHAWSHEAAWEHVRRTGGFGWGLYVNYLFVVVWLADVIWAWASLDGYLNRPRWVSWCVYGFMAFIMFNATVVFAARPVRVVGVLTFVLIALGWLALRRSETPEPGSRPGSAESVE